MGFKKNVVNLQVENKKCKHVKNIKIYNSFN